MHTAILLDGTKNPTCIRLNEQDAGQAKSGQKKSIAWSGAATKPAKDFNFIRVIKRDDGEPGQREVLIYHAPGLKRDARVVGLRMKDLDVTAQDGPVTVAQQEQILADQYLYPEKYIEMGQSIAA